MGGSYSAEVLIRMLNHRQVEAFRAVMLTGGVTAAAVFLSVTQPAVSRLLRDLERNLDLRLFDRRRGRLLPTSEGASLYQEVERSFVGLQAISDAAAKLREREAGTLRVASLPALFNGLLPRFIGRFLVARPDLDLSLFGLASYLVRDWVASGRCDLGFAESPLEHATVRREALPAVAAVAAVPSRHRLARKRRLRPEDLNGEYFISLSPFTILRRRLDEVFAEHGVQRWLRTETPLSFVACSMVAAGAGLSIVDPFSAQEFGSEGVVFLPFEPRVDVEFSVLTPTQRPLSGVARDFISEARQEIERFARTGYRRKA
jgi:DNA-binding transcriptional LysR family regulator